MADPQTFDELKAAIAGWGDRSDDDVDAIAAECVALAERRFQREIRAPEREATTRLATTAEAIDLPADLWGIRATFLDTDPKTVLEPMTLAELRNLHSAGAAGRPQHYAVRGEQLVLGPAPDAEYDLVLTYVQTIPALSDANADNWLLARHPDLYLHASLVELCTRFRDSDGIAIHEGKAAGLIESINRSAARRSCGGAPIRIRAPQVV